MKYHTDFFQAGQTSRRTNLNDRIAYIRPHLSDGGKMLDVGCSGGFNSFALREDFDHIDAFDIMPELIADCQYISDKNNTHINFYVSNLFDEIKKPDEYEVILYLSTHHHVINQFGMPEATKILRELFKKTNTMFFDMGQKDEQCFHPWWQKLPKASPNQKNWLHDYLKDATGATTIELIGSTPIHQTERLLWKIKK